jgi:lipid-A-disaccharide synthase
MLIAGEASGDAHAAALVESLRSRWEAGVGVVGPGAFPPRFFGAGGPRMAAAGVDLEVDLTRHAVVGLLEVFRKLRQFRRLGRRLLDVACERTPEVIILVDFGGFNLRFASAIRRRIRQQRGVFANWSPKIVYFVSPQVWASRAGRADRLARNVDLLLSIFPFERAWYARRAPSLRVEFVGHPLVDRFAEVQRRPPSEWASAECDAGLGGTPRVLLLPGSRRQEVRRHLPILAEAVRQLNTLVPVRPWMALPSEALLALAQELAPVRRAQSLLGDSEGARWDGVLRCRIGEPFELMRWADLALAKSGSVTLECAFHGLPTVVFYRVAWPTWWIARCLVRVPFAAMPNLLGGRVIYPEFLQGRATPGLIAREAAGLLRDQSRRRAMREESTRVARLLGPTGAADRAAEAILGLVGDVAALRG